MSVLGNFVRLSDGIPKKLHFKTWRLEMGDWTDPMTKQPKHGRKLILDVDEEDGVPVSKVYSVLSEKHAQQLAPYLQSQEFPKFDFVIIMRGFGFQREYTTEIRPRGPGVTR